MMPTITYVSLSTVAFLAFGAGCLTSSFPLVLSALVLVGSLTLAINAWSVQLDREAVSTARAALRKASR